MPLNSCKKVQQFLPLSLSLVCIHKRIRYPPPLYVLAINQKRLRPSPGVCTEMQENVWARLREPARASGHESSNLAHVFSCIPVYTNGSTHMTYLGVHFLFCTKGFENFSHFLFRHQLHLSSRNFCSTTVNEHPAPPQKVKDCHARSWSCIHDLNYLPPEVWFCCVGVCRGYENVSTGQKEKDSAPPTPKAVMASASTHDLQLTHSRLQPCMGQHLCCEHERIC